MTFLAILAASVAVSLADADGRPLADSSVELKVVRSERDGVSSVRAEVTGRASAPRQIRLEARLEFGSGAKEIFDGARLRAPDGIRTNALWSGAFPLTAVLDGRKGVAFAMDAEGYYPYVDFISTPQALVMSARVALLGPGAKYEAEFLTFGFDAKYDVRDAFARYYALYPRLFRKRPGTTHAVYGPCAHYASWRQADPERCRFMHATWEWCIGAGRFWGDPLGTERLVGKKGEDYTWDPEFRFTDRSGRPRIFLNEEVSTEEYRKFRDERLGFGSYCGVENAFYVMVLANISHAIAARHPDSVAVGPTCTRGSYPASTEVFTFPECSWGRETRRLLAELSATADLSAIGFDVARARTEYRGERLRAMRNVGWDKDGPAIPRGIANGKLFDDLRGVRTKDGREVALVVNSDTRYHMSDIFHADVMMAECAPWHRRKPFPILDRLAMGEKGVTLWEGFRPKDFDAGFPRWPAADQDRFVNELARFTVHSSLRTGAALPCGFTSGYTALFSQAWNALVEAGWKPVPGALAADGDWEVTRYGRGAESFLAVNNLVRSARTCELMVFPEELATDRAGGKGRSASGYVFAPYFGGRARQVFGPDGEKVSVSVGPQLATVLECVATASGRGALEANWEGDFETMRLRIVRKGFKGRISFRPSIGHYRLEREDDAGTVYRTTELPGALAAIRAARGFDEIRHAPDADSADQAARMAVFFRRAGSPADGKGPRLVRDDSLGARTVAVAGFAVSADNRGKLAERIGRFLDVVNHERFPHYGPPVPMPDDVSARYPLQRD
mgnify:CR=1 FL=1